MKKIIRFTITLSVIILAISLSLCILHKNNIENHESESHQSDARNYTITFMLDSEIYYTLNTSGYCSISLPDNPSKDNYEFYGWFFDENEWKIQLTTLYYNDLPLTENVSVFAKFNLLENINDNQDDNNNDFTNDSFIDDEIEYRQLSTGEYEIVGGNIDKIGDTTYNVVSIADEAFMSNISQDSIFPEELHSFKLPSTVKRIGDRAFYMCGLFSIDFSDNAQLEFIGDYAFYGNNHLEKMVWRFPESLKHIGSFAIANNSQCFLPWLDSNISSVTVDYKQIVYLPCELTYLGENAFYGMKLCRVINLSENLYNNEYYNSLVNDINVEVFDKIHGNFQTIDDMLFFQNNQTSEYSLIYYGNSKKVVNDEGLEMVILSDYGFDYSISSFVFYDTKGVKLVDFQKNCRATEIKQSAFSKMEDGHGDPFSIGDTIAGHSTQYPNFIFSTKINFHNISLEFGWIDTYLTNYNGLHMGIIGGNKNEIEDLITILDNSLISDKNNRIQLSTTIFDGTFSQNYNFYSVFQNGWTHKYIDENH